MFQLVSNLIQFSIEESRFRLIKRNAPYDYNWSTLYDCLMTCLHETHLPEVNQHFYCTALHFAVVKCITSRKRLSCKHGMSYDRLSSTCCESRTSTVHEHCCASIHTHTETNPRVYLVSRLPRRTISNAVSPNRTNVTWSHFTVTSSRCPNICHTCMSYLAHAVEVTR